MRFNRLALLLLVAPTAFAHRSAAMYQSEDIVNAVQANGLAPGSTRAGGSLSKAARQQSASQSPCGSPPCRSPRSRSLV